MKLRRTKNCAIFGHPVRSQNISSQINYQLCLILWQYIWSHSRDVQQKIALLYVYSCFRGVH